MDTYEQNLSNQVLVVQSVKEIGGTTLSSSRLSSIKALLQYGKADAYNAIVAFQNEYSLDVAGSLVATEGYALLSAVVRKDGVIQAGSEFSIGREFKWTSTRADSTFSATGKDGIRVPSSEIEEDGTRFTLTWDHEMEGGTARFEVPFTLHLAQIVKYAWLNYTETADVIRDDSSIAWFDEAPVTATADYLWRKVSNDDGETWKYFRETGTKGESASTWILSVSSQYYRLSDRSYTVAETNIECNMMKLGGYEGTIASWTVADADGNDISEEFQTYITETQDGLSISIPANTRLSIGLILTVTATDGSERTSAFSCIDLPTYSPARVPTSNSIPTSDYDENGVPYVDGDYMLVQLEMSDGTVENFPYVFKVAADGSYSWEELTPTNDSDWAKKIQTMLVEATSVSSYDIQNATAFMLWVRNFFAKDAVISNLHVDEITSNDFVDGSDAYGKWATRGFQIKSGDENVARFNYSYHNNMESKGIKVYDKDNTQNVLFQSVQKETDSVYSVSIDASYFKVEDLPIDTDGHSDYEISVIDGATLDMSWARNQYATVCHSDGSVIITAYDGSNFQYREYILDEDGSVIDVLPLSVIRVESFVAHGNGFYIGDYNGFYKSYDGHSWTKVANYYNGTPIDLCYHDGLFYCLTRTSSGTLVYDYKIHTSSDGINWSLSSSETISDKYDQVSLILDESGVHISSVNPKKFIIDSRVLSFKGGFITSAVFDSGESASFALNAQYGRYGFIGEVYNDSNLKYFLHNGNIIVSYRFATTNSRSYIGFKVIHIDKHPTKFYAKHKNFSTNISTLEYYSDSTRIEHRIPTTQNEYLGNEIVLSELGLSPSSYITYFKDDDFIAKMPTESRDYSGTLTDASYISVNGSPRTSITRIVNGESSVTVTNGTDVYVFTNGHFSRFNSVELTIGIIGSPAHTWMIRAYMNNFIGAIQEFYMKNVNGTYDSLHDGWLPINNGIIVTEANYPRLYAWLEDNEFTKEADGSFIVPGAQSLRGANYIPCIYVGE